MINIEFSQMMFFSILPPTYYLCDGSRFVGQKSTKKLLSRLSLEKNIVERNLLTNEKTDKSLCHSVPFGVNGM